LGAIVAMLFAERFRQWVDRILAIGMPDGSQTLPAKLFASLPGELADWLLSRSASSEAARAEAAKADPRAVQNSLSSLQGLNLVDKLQRVDLPFLLVYGQNDPAFPAPVLSDSPTDLPQNMHQIVFEGVGHFPMLDDSSKFNRLLADFLSLESGVSPRQLQLKEEWKRRVR
jgi:pimeloyl-ACP methyl ester carboxylesterase